MMKNIIVVLLVLIFLPTVAAPLPPELKLDRKRQGAFDIGGFKFEIIAFSKDRKNVNNRRWYEVKSLEQSGGMTFNGVILLAGSKGQVTESIMPLEGDRFEVLTKARFEPQLNTPGLVGNFSVSVNILRLHIDGKELTVPVEFKKQTLYSGEPQEVVLQGFGAYELVITGCTKVAVVDNRGRGEQTCDIRFYFNSGSGSISTADLKLNCKLRRFEMKTVSLAPQVNRLYRDEPEKIGWTAQGADEDLRMFKPGNYNFESVPFDLNAPGAVAVGGINRGGISAEAVVPLRDSTGFGAVNLAHTSAWTPAGDFGEMIFTYADNSTHVITLSGSRDCGDWLNPRNRGNAVTAWEVNRPGAKVGFYLSSFPLPRANPVSVTFRSTHHNVLWFVMGMTFSQKALKLSDISVEKSYITAGKYWLPLEFNNYPVAGSALDFSGTLDAPAGKYGFVKAMPDGTLRFEKAPERRLKLLGTNLCQSANYPSRESAVKIADIFERLGYNSVRFHHHDDGLVKKDSPDSVTLDPEVLERFDFFFAELKKRGFYITTDIYTSRKFKPGDNIPNIDMHPKALLPVCRVAMENWKAFARNWMTHRNPYTGLTYAEDPAMVMINLVNEDNLNRSWSRNVSSRDFYTKLFEEYKKQHNIPDAKADNSDRCFLSFLMELQEKSLAEMQRFLKEDLKMKSTITSLNYMNQRYLVPMRNRFDVVDKHGYHDHPSFMGAIWNSKRIQHQVSAIARGSSMVRGMMTGRITGKPFLVTEYNFCYPNQFRAEGGPLMGGYAALQDWDGLYQFCYSHNIRRIDTANPIVGSFESVNDPIMQLSERIIHALFLRGDAAPASRMYSVGVPENILQTNQNLSYSPIHHMLGLIARIGSHVEGASLPPGVNVIKGDDFSEAPEDVAEWRNSIGDNRIKSSTGQIEIDSKNIIFTVYTPKTESITLREGQQTTGGVLSVDVDSFQTVAAIALDNRSLVESLRILILHMTDVLNGDTVFQNSEHKIFENEGKLPLLIRRGRADISLKLPKAKQIKVTALSPDGESRGEVAAENIDGSWNFTADTGCFPGGVMAYEVTVK